VNVDQPKNVEKESKGKYTAIALTKFFDFAHIDKTV